MPKNKELRVKMIWLHHDMPAARHGRKWKMTELVTKNYWWLEVTKDVGKYVDKCDIYQRIKNRIEILVEHLMANEVLERL